MHLAINKTFAKLFELATISNYLENNSDSGVRNLKSKKLNKGEVFRVPSDCRLNVLSGVAWITLGGEDIILTSGKEAVLRLNKDFAVVSALGNFPLIFEVL